MNESVVELVKKFSESRKPIASICHGQLILAAAGVVKGQKCTAFNAVKPVLIAAGADWVEPETEAFCTRDGNLITGATYDGHPEYIRLFIKALGANISGSGKRILFLCGVSFNYHGCKTLNQKNLISIFFGFWKSKFTFIINLV